MTKTEDHLQLFPKPVTVERVIPAEIWPDLKGVRQAKVVVADHTVRGWRGFWKTAKNFPMVSVDFETSGLVPFKGSRIVGVASAYYDGEEVHAGYWNFRHTGHPPHPWCQTHPRKRAEVLTMPEEGTDQKLAKVKAVDRITKIMEKCERCQDGECPGQDDHKTRIDVSELPLMVSVFENCIVAGQNYKYDQKMAYVDGLPFPRRVIDSMLVAHLWDENKKGYSLAALGTEMGEQKLGDSVKAYMETHGLEVEGHGHEQVAYEVEKPYAIQDAVLVLRRLQYERERWLTLADPKLMEVFQVETAQSPIFAKMEAAGMKLDIPYVRAGVIQFEAEMRGLEREIWDEAGKEFNILSLDELWDVLSARGLKARSTSMLSSTALRESMRGEREKSGKPSLNDFDLTYYGDQGDRLCPLIKEYRVRSKMCGTYFKPFLETHADPQGFIHPDYVINGTTSGRISCKDPNVQNITKLEKFGARAATGSIARAVRTKIADKTATDDQHHLEVRRCFVPRSPDHSLFFFDYNQMEMRVFTDYTDEQFMMKAIEEGMDIHAAVAQKVFPNFPKKEDDPKMYSYFRTLAKQISFGLIYGMGVNKLSRQLDVPVDEPMRLIGMVMAAHEEGFDIRKATTYTIEQCLKVLEDHEVMTSSRMWPGLKVLGKEITMKVNPEPLEEFLFGTPEMKDKHNRLAYSARAFLTSYHAQFPKIKQFSKGIEKAIATRGYIFNKYGRRYHMRTDESYVGINRLVQGSSADMVKVAGWRISSLLQGKKSVMMNQIHDEVQVDVHRSELHLVEMIREAMQHFPNLKVKMQVDVEYSSETWAKKVKWEGVEKFEETLAEFKESKVTREEKSKVKETATKKPAKKKAVARTK